MEYRNPTPVVDIIIEMGDQIVLIKRKNPPHGWALPGGFVDEGEPLSTAAIREAKEETSLDVQLTEQFFTYSNPTRDPRSHNVSTVFLAQADGVPRAADDAKDVALFCQNTLPRLAFDHAQILNDYFRYRQLGHKPPADR